MCHASMRGSLSSAGAQVPSASWASRFSRASVVRGQEARPFRPVAVTTAMRVSGKAWSPSGWKWVICRRSSSAFAAGSSTMVAWQVAA